MSLLKSLFTEHLATKFMSLLLAIVLFAIVQQQLEGVRTVEAITLQFDLTEDDREDYSLISSNVSLIDLKIKGKLRDVDAKVEQFKSAPERRMNINQDFLRRYEGKTVIVVDEKFLHDHDILPKDISVAGGLTGNEKLRIEKNTDFLFELARAKTGNITKLDDDSDFETPNGGRNVEVSFLPSAQVKVRAPKAMFGRPEGGKLYVRFGNVNTHLNSPAFDPDTEPSMRVDEFDYEENGINEDLFKQHGQFLLGGRYVRFSAFKDALSVTFKVSPRKVEHSLDLPLEFRVDVRKLAPLDGLEDIGPKGSVSWNRGDYAAGVTKDFKIRYSKIQITDKDRDAKLKALVLVLDVSRLEQADDEKALVPIRLGVNDPTQEGLLKHVEIHMKAGEEGKTPYIIFRKKQ